MRLAWAMPSMAAKLMEGSYYILLIYILLCSFLPIYIAAEATHRCKIRTPLLKHTNFRKTMAHFLPDHLFYHSPHYPASHHRRQMSPLSTRQRDEFSVDAWSSNNVQTTVSLDHYNVDRTGSLRLNNKTTTYSLKTEILRRPTLSGLGVSHPSMPTATSDQPTPGLAVYNGGDSQGSIIRHGPTSSVPASNNVSLQEDSLRQQLPAAVYGNLPIPPELTNRRNLPRDVPPLTSISSGGSGNQTCLAAGSTTLITETFPYRPRPSQPPFTSSQVNSLEPPQNHDPSNVYIPHYQSSNTNPNCFGPSAVPATVHSSNQQYPAPNETTFNGLGGSTIFTQSHTSGPHRTAPNTSSSKDFKLLGTPTPSQKSTIPCSRTNTKKSKKSGPLSSVATRHLAPMVSSFKKVQPSQKIGGPRVNNPNGPTLLSISTGNRHKEQDPFELYTNHYENDTDEWTVAGFDAPSAPVINNTLVSGAQESHTGQYCTSHLGGDTASRDVPQPPKKPQQRNKVQQTEKAKAERQHKPQQRNKIQETEKARAERRHKPQQRNKIQTTERATAERRQPSTNPRRTNPNKRYFCLYPDCKRSKGKGWHGFPNNSERDRHHKCHLNREFFCDLPHVDGEEKKWFRRRDGLDSYVFPIA